MNCEHLSDEEIVEMGKERGRNAAGWFDVPEIGAEIPQEFDWIGYHTVTVDNLYDVCVMIVGQNEEHSRQFSPFEFTAAQLNMQDDPDYCWELFEEAITEGINEYFTEYFAD